MKRFFITQIKSLKQLRWRNFVALTFAGIINAVGVTMFLAPVGIYDGGLSGTAMLLWKATSVSLSVFLVALNLPFFLFGLKKQGAVFTVYSIYAILIYSVSAYLINNVIPIDVSESSPFAGNDLILCALFGGLVSGIGSGLTIRFGGAIDGVEVMAVIFAKFIGLTVGTFVMIYNAIIYIVAAIVFKSWLIPLYSIIAYTVGLKAVDFIVEGFDKAKAAMIISSKTEETALELSKAFGRGLTVWNAQGYFSGQKKLVLYCVVNRFQISRLKRIVSSVDPNAFVTITEISDTLGTSFKLTRRKKRRPMVEPFATEPSFDPSDDFLDPSGDFLDPSDDFLDPSDDFLDPSDDFLDPSDDFLDPSDDNID